MTWIYHDSFTSIKKAKKYGNDVVELGLTHGIKVVKNKEVSNRPYSLYLLALEKEVK